MKTVVKIDIRAVEISEAGGINQQLNALAFEEVVVRLNPIKRHAVLKTGTTAALDKHAEFFFGITLARMHRLDLTRRTWSES